MSAIPDTTSPAWANCPAMLPEQNREAFARLHSSVTSDWGPGAAHDPSDSGAV